MRYIACDNLYCSALPLLSEAPIDRLPDVRDTSLAKLVHDDMPGRILKEVLLPDQRINGPDGHLTRART